MTIAAPDNDEDRMKASLLDAGYDAGWADAIAQVEQLRTVLIEARTFVEGMVTPVKAGVMQISSYHPCHALIDKINAALAFTGEQAQDRKP